MTPSIHPLADFIETLKKQAKTENKAIEVTVDRQTGGGG